MFHLPKSSGYKLEVTNCDLKFGPRIWRPALSAVGLGHALKLASWSYGRAINIEIMRAFVRLREVLATNRELSQKLVELERKFGTHDEQIQAIFEAIRQLMTPAESAEPPRKEIGFHIKEDGVPYRINRPLRKSRAER